MTRTAIVFGCGGTIGATWIVAALYALAERTGLDPRDADVLQGTSAGAETVTMLAGGAGVQDLVDMHRGVTHDERLRGHLEAAPSALPPLPRPALLNPGLLWTHRGLTRIAGLAPTGRADTTWLKQLAATFSGADGQLPHPGARMVAFDYNQGRRVVFGAPGSPPATVAEALRASCAIPGWMPPVQIGDNHYVDGGVASTASLDLLLIDDIDTAYVIAPMASRAGHRVPGLGGRIENRLLRRPMSATLRAETDQLRARGTQVVSILPTGDDLAGLGANFMNRRHRQAAFDSAMITAPATVTRALANAGVRP